MYLWSASESLWMRSDYILIASDDILITVSTQIRYRRKSQIPPQFFKKFLAAHSHFEGLSNYSSGTPALLHRFIISSGQTLE